MNSQTIEQATGTDDVQVENCKIMSTRKQIVEALSVLRSVCIN